MPDRHFWPGNVYVELQRHFHREEEARNHAVIEIARTLQLPLLATNGVCYATAAGARIADVFTAFAIIERWKLPGVCWRATPSVI